MQTGAKKKFVIFCSIVLGDGRIETFPLIVGFFVSV